MKNKKKSSLNKKQHYYLFSMYIFCWFILKISNAPKTNQCPNRLTVITRSFFAYNENVCTLQHENLLQHEVVDTMAELSWIGLSNTYIQSCMQIKNTIKNRTENLKRCFFDSNLMFNNSLHGMTVLAFFVYYLKCT